jgi:hypothetical protein
MTVHQAQWYPWKSRKSLSGATHVTTYCDGPFLLMQSTSYTPHIEIAVYTKTGKRPKGTNVISSNKFTAHSQQNIWEAPTTETKYRSIARWLDASTSIWI